jgi:hypothetical protein
MMSKIWRAAALAAVGAIAAALPARAEFRVRLPVIEEGEVALEHNGSYGLDRTPAKRGEQSYTGELEKAVNAWWLTEFEVEAGRDPGPDNRARLTALTWENLFVLTEPGEYWADFGFFAEYARGLPSQSADQLTFGPIISKVIGPTVNTLNVFFGKDVGNHAAGTTAVSLAWQTRLTVSRFFDPGIEIYSTPGTLTSFTPLQRQDNRAGPVFYGTLRSFGTSKFNYEVGYLFGLTRRAPDGTVKWKLEYEFRF